MCVEGRLQRDNWTDKDSVKRTIYKIVAESCYFAEGRKEQDAGQNAPSGLNGQYNNYANNPPDDFDPFGGGDGSDDDLPY